MGLPPASALGCGQDLVSFLSAEQRREGVSLLLLQGSLSPTYDRPLEIWMATSVIHVKNLRTVELLTGNAACGALAPASEILSTLPLGFLEVHLPTLSLPPKVPDRRSG